jgi:hypothetical protein
MGPDGHVHTQGDLTHRGAARRWQDMLMPPAQ